MVVTSRCFAFRALITQAQIWKSFWVQNSTSLLYLPIPSSAETWNIFTNKLCQFCFPLSCHFNREKSVFWKHLFAKQELIARASLRVHDATGKHFSFNQCHDKELFRLGFALLSRILPTSLVFISGYANTENVLYCLSIIERRSVTSSYHGSKISRWQQ